ncbi:TPM domain-containing protein [Methylocaldum sp.]|uniref:TPM domain-containing protein n=1 Tax=Methylocaldum sp. TaxID=1969727 RepID=UPI002D53F5DC|nr:TPM domain-containing protein [Methylocaldum sp.]HYE35931.1 TPM domain-containing protein [Methylocaldum sp.]
MFKNLGRILKHLCYGPWRLRRVLPRHSLKAITEAIRDSERKHGGEIRFAVENSLDWRRLLRRETPRERALEVFSELRVWDTERNNGVLIYLLLADRDVEIVADRGIDRLVGSEAWERICHEMEAAFREGDFESGILVGVQAVGTHLEKHFAGSDLHGNELANRPIIIDG